ncbi:hypothetical protein ACNKGS_18180 [Acinetobacter baumannii]
MLAISSFGPNRIKLARSEYNAATSANARAVAVQRLTAAEIAYNVATKEAIATTEAYSNSQKKLNGIQTHLLVLAVDY